MKRSVLFCVFVFTWSFIAYSANTELYQQAAALYSEKKYEEAAQQYEQLIANGAKAYEVYYNLGNCYFKLNQLGKSIVWYERALQLAPNDEEIKHNLSVANARTIDKIDPVPQLAIITAWRNFLNLFSANVWRTIALSLVWSGLLLAVIYVLVYNRRWLVLLSAFVVVLSFSTLGIASHVKRTANNHTQAVLITSNAYVKSAPDNTAIDAFMLHEGVKFTLLDKVNQWSKIRLTDGKTGWLQKEHFEII